MQKREARAICPGEMERDEPKCNSNRRSNVERRSYRLVGTSRAASPFRAKVSMRIHLTRDGSVGTFLD